MNGHSELDAILLTELNQLDDFLETATTVVAAFPIVRLKVGSLKKTGSFGKASKDKSKVICFCIKDRGAGKKKKGSLVYLKRNNFEGFQRREAWKIKSITSLCAQPIRNQPQYHQLTLNLSGFSSESFTFTAKEHRDAFVGCILSYIHDIFHKKIECVGLEPNHCLRLWQQLSKSPTVPYEQPTSEQPVQKPKTPEVTKPSEDDTNDLELFIKETGFSLTNLKGFEGFLQTRLSNLDTSNINAIFENMNGVDSVISKVNTTLGYVDDLEEWLNVFNAKLQHMRRDISAIEERNNALETKANSNSALLDEVRLIEDQLTLDPHIIQTIRVCNLDNASNIEASAKAATQLHDILSNLESDAFHGDRNDNQSVSIPSTLKDIRAVRECRSQLKILRNQFLSQTKSFFASFFKATTTRAVQSLHMQSVVTMSDKKMIEGAIEGLQDDCNVYNELFHVVAVLDSTVADSLSRSYADCTNQVIRKYMRAICSKPTEDLGAEALADSGPKKEKGANRGDKLNSKFFKLLGKKKETSVILPDSIVEEVPLMFKNILGTAIPHLCKECEFCGMCFYKVDMKGGHNASKENGLASNHCITNPGLMTAIECLLKDSLKDVTFFIEKALEIDMAFSVPFMKIIRYWISKLAKTEVHYRIHQWLNEYQLTNETTFQRYMENYLNHIEIPKRGVHVKPVKHIWILPYFLKLPQIVEHIESLSQQIDEDMNSKDTELDFEQSDSHVAKIIDEAYSDYSEKIFIALEKIASKETKVCHAERLRIENYGFFCSSLGSYHQSDSKVSKYFELAGKRIEESIEGYVEDACAWTLFAETFQFLQKLENLLREFPKQDVQFHFGFTPEDLKEAMSKIPSDNNATNHHIHSLRNRIQKHFKNDAILYKRMWKTVGKEMSVKLAQFENLVMESYTGFGAQLPWQQLRLASTLLLEEI